MSSKLEWPVTAGDNITVHATTETLEETNTKAEQTELPLTETAVGIHKVIEVSRYSSLKKLLKITALVYRFIGCVRKQSGIAMGVISADELQTAEQIWIRNTQQFAFQEEILNLQKTTPSVKLVRQLRLFLDSADLLRCGGRINNAPLSESAKIIRNGYRGQTTKLIEAGMYVPSVSRVRAVSWYSLRKLL